MVAAVPGAGKTTALQILSRMRPDITIVNFGDHMYNIAAKKYGIKQRDKMRKTLELGVYRQIQCEAAKKISKIDGKVVIDTHLAIKMDKGLFYPGLPLNVAKLLSPDYVVLIELDPKIVIERRLKDLSLKHRTTTAAGTISEFRIRELETEEEINLHQMINRYYAVAISTLTSALIKIIDLRKVSQTEPFAHAKHIAEELSKMFTP